MLKKYLLNLTCISLIGCERGACYIGGNEMQQFPKAKVTPQQIPNFGSRRHLSVPGVDGKANDVIARGDVATAKSHVIFFGGDVQDYPEKMLSHRDNKRYTHWNLESTSQILWQRFKESAIFVIKPKRMHLHTFSVYSNFVQSNDFGSPTHQHSYGSWHHLRSLHKNIISRELGDGNKSSQDYCCKEDSDCSKKDSDKDNYSSIPIKLVGFSKGCIVLNQLLYDLPMGDEGRETSDFIGRIEEFYWLDGGHSGGSNTWICDTEILQNFAGLHSKVIVHVTPYQVQDPVRTWVGKEEKKFVSKLKKFGADVTETIHFETEPGSIDNHFRVLEEF